MKLAVFGATGGTGQEFVSQALDAGHEVNALIHIKDLGEREGVETFKGDAKNYDDVEKTVEGCDAVVSMIGSKLGGKPVCEDGVRNMIKAMEEHDIDRIIVESAYGAGSPRKGLYPVILRLMIRPLIKDKEEMEERLKQTDLNYTIVRPSMLTDGVKTNNYMVGEEVIPSFFKPQISRADTAAFMLSELENQEFSRKTINISGT